MLQVVSALKGYDIQAEDGRLGTVSDVLFDDQSWKARWLVVDTGTWLTERKVLIHPSAIGAVDFERRALSVALTKKQVEESPDIRQDRPVSRQMQNDLYGYYGWDPYWGGGMYGLYGAGMYGGGLAPIAANRSASAARHAEHCEIDAQEGDPNLRSAAEVTGYHIHATDGGIGHVEDIIIESSGWGIRYLVVDTSNWWFGQHVLIAANAVREVDWSGRQVHLDVAREQVKTSPPWDPASMITEDGEKRLHTHYGWPGYGW